MAYDNIEIEIKLMVSEEVFKNIEKYLQKNGKYLGEKNSKDQYFTPTHKNFLDNKYPYEWLSLRERGDKVIINFKHWYPENAEVNTHCDEYDLIVDSADKARSIFEALDIKELITVNKHRKSFSYKDSFQIDLDYIEELGYSIEIEAVKNVGSVEETRKMIYKIVAELGIKEINKDNRGDPYRLMVKKGLL